MAKSKNELRDMLDDFFPEKLTPGMVIRAKRKNFGITQKEVAEATGITESNISKYENDHEPIGYVQATKIGLAIGLSPLTILFPEGIEKDERFTEVAKKGGKLLKSKLKKFAG